MSTAQLRSNLHLLIDSIKDSNTLNALYNIISQKVKAKNVDWWDELTAEQKAGIEEGLAQAESGALIPHEQVMKEIKAKYKIK